MEETADPSAILLLLSDLLFPPSTTVADSSPHAAGDPSPLMLFAAASAVSAASLSSSLLPSLPSPPLSLSSLRSLPPHLRDSRCRSHMSLPFSAVLAVHRTLSPHSSSIPLPLELALPITLSRLARAASLSSVSSSFSVPPSLASRVVHSVTRLLATALYPSYVQLPSDADASSSFEFPGSLGAISSSPVRLAGTSDSVYFSASRTFPSVLLQVVADWHKVFVDACVLVPGSVEAAAHFRASSLYHRLVADSSKSNGVAVRGQYVRPFLIGDAAFPLLPFVLTPFGGPGTTKRGRPEHEVFDQVLAQARAATVEPSVALLKGRWRILRNLDVSPEHAAQTVVACVVLHNACQLAGEAEGEARVMWHDPPETVPQPAQPTEVERQMHYAGERIRQALAEDLYERQQNKNLGGINAR